MKIKNDFHTERRFMIENNLRTRGITDQRVLDAFEKIPRHEFVMDSDVRESYADHPLPIGEGQTISQPYIVALMTQALELTGSERVLEVGTGSGYQTAILSLLAGRVYTVERIEALLDAAVYHLGRMGLANIEFRHGDGTTGWEEEGPFDCIMVTAAAPEVPQSLVAQLADGGRMVIPVGSAAGQDLTLLSRGGDDLERRRLCGCVFVKLIGKEGWEAR
ncbi:protein-L-isoaspartate(D-aspartate) O-methyltransferase [Planctomycetota bacterium]